MTSIESELHVGNIFRITQSANQINLMISERFAKGNKGSGIICNDTLRPNWGIITYCFTEIDQFSCLMLLLYILSYIWHLFGKLATYGTSQNCQFIAAVNFIEPCIRCEVTNYIKCGHLYDGPPLLEVVKLGAFSLLLIQVPIVYNSTESFLKVVDHKYKCEAGGQNVEYYICYTGSTIDSCPYITSVNAASDQFPFIVKL